MKRIGSIVLKVFLVLVLVILVTAFAVPLIFKDKIKTRIEQVINNSVNAKVDFADYKMGFFRNFPNLSFALEEVNVVGVGKFEKDTLTSFRSLNLVFNLASLFKKSGYEVNSIILDEANIKAVVLEDGSANWDIMKESGETEAEEETSSDMKIVLKRVKVLNSSVSYSDISSVIDIFLNQLELDLKGDMTMSETDLEIFAKAGDLTFIMEEIKYLNKASAEAIINVKANLDSLIFYLQDAYLKINELALNFSGMVAMPGDDYKTDLTFRSEQGSLKALLSMMPAVYLTDFQDLRTTGEFMVNGSAKGIYSDADSTLPDINLDLTVNNGVISYPELPEKITNINISSVIFVDGKNMDNSTVNVEKFHMELAGNPFDMSLSVKTPESDPDIRGTIKGKIDLTALSNAIPLDSIDLSGLIDISLSLAGRMSMLEKAEYDKFSASGAMNISKMMLAMPGYPEVKINAAGFTFTPAYASLSDADLNIGGRSDFSVAGRLENYIPYVVKNDLIRGNLTLHSRLIDLSEIVSKLGVDTTETEDTSSLAVIKIPENVDFDFTATVDELIYNRIKAKNLKGHIIVKNGILSMRETGMNILGGAIVMNADYDPIDTLKPSVRMDLSLERMGIKDAFNSFSTVRKLAPTLKGIGGSVNAKITYSSLLGQNLMPVFSSINGGGKLQSSEITLIESVIYNKMKETLKLGEKYSNTFKDINVSFKINDGRVFVSPFNVKVGNIKMNLSGDHGIDQTINYIVKTEIPRSDLGASVNSLIDVLSKQASQFGFNYKPADLIKVNVKVSGTFFKPVVSPFFGNAPADSISGVKTTVKETVKEAVESKVVHAKETVRSEAEIQADKLITEATEKGELLRDEAAKTAEKLRLEADQQSQKLIGEAESKGPIAKLAAQKAADSIKKEADRKAEQLIKEADNQANKLLEEAKVKREELLKKIE